MALSSPERPGQGKRPDKRKPVKFTDTIRRHLSRAATAQEMAHKKKMSAKYELFTYQRREERQRAVICELRGQGHCIYRESVGDDEWPFESTSAGSR